MRENARKLPKSRDQGIGQKHATPLVAPEETRVALNEVRPVALFPDRDSFNMVPRSAQEILALKKHYSLEASTGKRLVEQWQNQYMALAHPFSIPRAVSCADFPNKRRLRREADAPLLEPLEFAKMVAARVEAGVRNDWTLVPSARNLATKWKALCGDDAACRHKVDMDKPGTVLAAELSAAAAGLYEKLQKGYWWDGRKRRKINSDVSKLQYAQDLSPMERDLVRDLTFLSSKVAGSQQIRLDIGHGLFGARVEYGDPIFLTISPSSRHSGLVARFSR